MGNNKITGVGEGTAAADAVTKSQLDLAAKLAVKQTWTAQQKPMSSDLVDGATVNWNCDVDGQSVFLIVQGNRTLAAPTNVVARNFYMLQVQQDGTGGRTLTWNAAYHFPGGVDPVLSTAANAIDIFSFVGAGGNVMRCVGQAKGLA